MKPLQRIVIVAGEASGDLLGAKTIAALKAQYPNLIIEGVGGPAMIAAGCRSLFEIERLSVMGLIEPLRRLPDLIRLRRDLYQHTIQHKPDLFIGIDAPDFNLGLELKLRRAGIRVAHIVSPSVWAWRKRRIHKIKKAVDMMLTLFPFEALFYQQHNVPVHYIGHPLAEQLPLEVEVHAARAALNLAKKPEKTRYIAILPGSRRQEIRYIAPVLLQAANQLSKTDPSLHFITSHVNLDRCKEFEAQLKLYAPDLPLSSFIQCSHQVMAAADVVMVTSGTATLETLLFKKPMVIVYRMHALTYVIASWLVKGPIGLPNILAGKLVVPEFIQDKATPEAIAAAVLDYLHQPEKVAEIQRLFTTLHQQLRQNSQAEIVLAIKRLMGSR